jgi:hypothetical protein
MPFIFGTAAVMFNSILSKVAIGSIAATASVGIFASSTQAATLVNLGEYTFGTGSGSLAPTNVLSGLTFTNFAYVGSGGTTFPSGLGAGKAFSANDFSPDATINPAINATSLDGDDYYQFGITASSGYTFSLANLGFATNRNGDASPTRIQVRSSVDGFSAFITGSDQALGGKNEWTPYNASLAFNNLTSITLRLYPYLKGANNGSQNLDIDNVSVQGSVTSTAVPTPALLPGLVGLGAGLLRKRKQAAL